ncbi:MAG: DUF1553 domain-containing protein [Planctomycetia bacterium]|nr:DUF1553 domain-containing protein [Planctomycetia bacterium]
MTRDATWAGTLASFLLIGGFSTPALRGEEPKAQGAPAAKVSYYKDIRPLFQAHCQGCHQPAKARGDYIMTDVKKLLAGGDSGKKAVEPNHPDKSYLVELIIPKDGKAKMPEGKKPLAEHEIDLVKQWIAQGAQDDTPANAQQRYDVDHPPLYTRPPVIAALDYSPDGKLLAVAGFHEVLLVDTETDKLTARLIGLAERIQTVRFSPDGKFLAVAGGLPGRMGEIQVWDAAKARLLLSAPYTGDSLFGVSWSPDGSKLGFGCTDNTVRAIDAKTGEQVLYQGSHTDWVLDTVFSKDGSHLVSVGRDMTVKLTEFATQRFVDNITSITPGVLKGGLSAVARHPQRDEIVIGGSDGIAKVYRIHRVTKRVIGDDANLIRQMPPMKGRIFSVAVSPDGKRIAAGSSLDGTGQVHIYGYEFNTDLPANIKAINEKVVTTRTPAEKEALEKYHQEGVQLIAQAEVKDTAVYAVAFRPDGQAVAAAGADGKIRLYDAATGNLLKTIAPAPLSDKAPPLPVVGNTATSQAEKLEPETLPAGASIVALEIEPKSVELRGKFGYAQLLVTAKLASGDTLDATRMVDWQLSANVAEINRAGLLRPKTDGSAKLSARIGDQTATVNVDVVGLKEDRPVDYVRDVMPVLSRLGCNQGTCHGSAQGKNGFKLSLRGYDPIFDVRALADDMASRRVNIASPDDSLMLLKATAAVPHVGGQVTRPGEPYYEIMRSWIANGARLDLSTPKVSKIAVLPVNPVVQQIGAKQQMRVLATYVGGQTRDVTQEAFIESGNTDVATAGAGGRMSAIRRGEAPLLVRFEGAYAATTLTVMGPRDGFVWEAPPTFNRIDELTAAKWQRMKIKPSDLSGDAEFLRRVHIDLTGLPPTADEVRAFLADARESRVKREEVIDKLVGSEAYIEHWSNKWADLLQVNRKFLGAQGAADFRKWIRNEVARNTPYDQFVRKILTASGSNRENPAAAYYKVLRDPASMMENTTHLFLAVRFNCNKCHDHPFERWTQDQYYETSAFFAHVNLSADPKGGNQQIGGTAVEKGKPLYEIVADKKQGEVLHERTNAVAPPKFPYEAKHGAPADASRRQQLAEWITSPDNQYFARSYVNRLWGYLFGVGIIDPIDDIRAGNPPSNPELLDYLTKEFVQSGFDARHIVKLITRSRTYQLAVASNQWNADDKINYSHATARRLSAEVLLDSVYRVTGSQSKFPGVPAGTRAAALPDTGDLPSGFLSTFGRPARESACECERVNTLQLGPVMALVNGQTLADAIGDPKNDIAKLVETEKDDAKLVNELFLRILNRPATAADVKAGIETIQRIEADHRQLVQAVADREKEVAPIRAKQEKDREVAMARGKAELEAYEKELAPKLAEQERARAEQIKQADARLQKVADKLPAKVAEWEKKQKSDIEWTVLDPKTLKGPGNAKLTTQPDKSVFVETPARGLYTLTAETDLRDITAIRLEVLSDKRLPNQGPGYASDGNFVLTEFEVLAASKAKPGVPTPVVFQKGTADVTQPNAQNRFDIKTAIDGDRDTAGGRGWAIGNAGGATHWATFEAKNAFGFEGGTLLTINLYQQFIENNFVMGRFRISVATAKRPVGLDLPEELKTVLAVAAEERKPEQQETLLRYYRTIDDDYKKVAREVADAKKPLPIDPKLKELRDNLEFVSRPIPEDPRLAQLKLDAAISEKQLANQRLTGAQDIAWALINSPAFLFNR